VLEMRGKAIEAVRDRRTRRAASCVLGAVVNTNIRTI
jgi:hypothetical protein